MRPQSTRAFTILDGMILVAAVAGGFGLRRAEMDDFEAYTSFVRDQAWVVPIARQGIEAGYPFLVALTPAALILRLRRPRPRWRRLARQPGTAACCAAIVPMAISLIGLHRFVSAMSDPVFLLPDGIEQERFGITRVLSGPPLGDLYGAYSAPVGVWILGAWLVLAITGIRRPERSWIDRLGRGVGIGWIAITAMMGLSYLLR